MSISSGSASACACPRLKAPTAIARHPPSAPPHTPTRPFRHPYGPRRPDHRPAPGTTTLPGTISQMPISSGLANACDAPVQAPTATAQAPVTPAPSTRAPDPERHRGPGARRPSAVPHASTRIQPFRLRPYGPARSNPGHNRPALSDHRGHPQETVTASSG